MVYILHFDRAFHHARHYVGYTDNLAERIMQHESGKPHHARLMEVIVQAGIKFTIARVWFGMDRHFERRIKNQKNTPKLCPICNKRIAHLMYQPECCTDPDLDLDGIEAIPY